MCAIAGVISRAPLEEAPALAARLDSSLAHRGPDDRGAIQPGEQVLLVHRRLAIIDPSPSGHQPMATRDGRYHIVYNGEAYNYRELRAELEADGERLETRSDTEVLLRLVARRGPAALSGVRGMFALAIWDGIARTLLLARDRFGIKPLYVARVHERVAFASEVGALVASGLVEPDVDPAGVLSYLRWASVLPPLTWVRGVEALPPGTWLRVDSDLRETRGTFADARVLWVGESAPSSRPELVQRTKSAIEDSVGAHLEADVPVGVFLSGGLDSAALVAAARSRAANLHTYTVVVQEADFSEAARAEAVARHFNTTHHTLEVTATSIARDWPVLLRHMDQPTADGVNTFYVARAVAQTGVKAVLSGVGGDEVFGGYPSFRRLPQALRLSRTALLPMAARAARLAERGWRGEKWRHLGGSGGRPEEVYRALRGFIMPAELDHVLGPRLRDARDAGTNLDHVEQTLMAPAGAESAAATAARLESIVYLRSQLLRDIDSMSMAHSLEVRVPFVDAGLIGAVWPAAGEDRSLLRGKRLLVDSLSSSLPDGIVGHPKQGFTLPFERWLDGPLHDIVRSGLERLSRDGWVAPHVADDVWTAWTARRVHWSRPWGLGVLGAFLEAGVRARA